MKLTSARIEDLLKGQLKDWKLARSNYEALSHVKTKEFTFDGFSVVVQFNPARIRSSGAKIDTKSIQERKCFLCPGNLPEEQKSILSGNVYQILVNPFPIFPKHFTIPTIAHTDQAILGRFVDMLDLAEDLDKFTIVYNGPKAGASAPDHAHFQAGNKGFLPIESDVKRLPKEVICEAEGLKVYTFKNYLRNVFLIEADSKESAASFFNKLYSLLELKERENEPMMNIITWYESKKWYSCIIPREKHRPDAYYSEGEDHILVSPGVVDLGGVLITVREEDFVKMGENLIGEIFREICISDEKMQKIITDLKDL